MSAASLIAFIASESTSDVPTAARRIYDAFCASVPNPSGVRAGLFYGSAFWKPPEATSVWDLYVLVDRWASVSKNPLLQWAGALLPPNVYYFETRDETGAVLRSKIAVMTLGQFCAHCRGQVLAPQTWARFAQPARLIASSDDAARADVIEALKDAVITFHRATAPWLDGPIGIEDFWQAGLTQTYASEFRAERSTRQHDLVGASREAFVARSTHALAEARVPGLMLSDGKIRATLPKAAARRARQRQRLRNRLSKAQHLARLVKAAFTFSGGLEYLVYKIARHSGVTLTPGRFARRYPLLGAVPLFIKGLRLGAFR